MQEQVELLSMFLGDESSEQSSAGEASAKASGHSGPTCVAAAYTPSAAISLKSASSCTADKDGPTQLDASSHSSLDERPTANATVAGDGSLQTEPDPGGPMLAAEVGAEAGDNDEEAAEAASAAAKGRPDAPQGAGAGSAIPCALATGSEAGSRGVEPDAGTGGLCGHAEDLELDSNAALAPGNGDEPGRGAEESPHAGHKLPELRVSADGDVDRHTPGIPSEQDQVAVASDAETCRDLQARQAQSGPERQVEGDSHTQRRASLHASLQVEYHVQLHTASIGGALKCGAFLTIVGRDGSLPEYSLAAYQGKIRSGQVLSVRIVGPPLGPLYGAVSLVSILNRHARFGIGTHCTQQDSQWTLSICRAAQ